jgi:hypothetical protein
MHEVFVCWCEALKCFQNLEKFEKNSISKVWFEMDLKEKGKRKKKQNLSNQLNLRPSPPFLFFSFSFLTPAHPNPATTKASVAHPAAPARSPPLSFSLSGRRGPPVSFLPYLRPPRPPRPRRLPTPLPRLPPPSSLHQGALKHQLHSPVINSYCFRSNQVSPS